VVVSSQQRIHDLGLMPSQRPLEELSSGLPVHETMWLPPLGQGWAQSPIQVLDTAEDIVFCMLAKGDTKIIMDEKWNPRGPAEGNSRGTTPRVRHKRL